jgi:ASC-1-like (ASCH) protein
MIIVILLFVIVGLIISAMNSSLYTGGNDNYEMFIQSPWYEEILKGTKIIEGRAGHKGRFDHLIGKIFTIKNKTHSTKVKLVKVEHYDTLDDYINASGWENIAPHTHSKEGTFEAYKNIYDTDGVQVYSDRNIKKREGMNALYLSLVDIDPEFLWKQYPKDKLLSVIFMIDPVEQIDFVPVKNTHLALAFTEKPNLAFFKELVKLIKKMQNDPADKVIEVTGHKTYTLSGKEIEASLVKIPDSIKDLIENFDETYGDRLPNMPKKREHHFSGKAPIGSHFRIKEILLRSIKDEIVTPFSKFALL